MEKLEVLSNMGCEELIMLCRSILYSSNRGDPIERLITHSHAQRFFGFSGKSRESEIGQMILALYRPTLMPSAPCIVC